MVAVDLKLLISTLDSDARVALENAAGLAMSRGHHSVELEHWLLKLLETTQSSIGALLVEQSLSVERVKFQLLSSIHGFRSGNTRPPALSGHIVSSMQAAYLLAGVEFQAKQISAAILFYAFLIDDELRSTLCSGCGALSDLSVEKIKFFIKNSAITAPETMLPTIKNGSALNRFAINLTEQAKQGKIDPVIGRELEVRQCIDILMRRRQNNPILTGEAGVGKTAIVEGLALRIIAGDVPDALKNVALFTLDLGLLQAGAAIKGEFEERLRQVIDEVKSASQPIILFIDEAHSLIGAGGKEGQGDAANLLKPALARGELRTIAATTWLEYKKYFERDPALTRRFQVVKVEEPSESVAVDMLRAVAVSMQQHHAIRIMDEAIVAAVRLSQRYLPERQLPDKAISVLDTASARAALSHSVRPEQLELLSKKIELTESSLCQLQQESYLSANSEQICDQLLRELDDLSIQKTVLENRWLKQKYLHGEMLNLETAINENPLENAAKYSSGLRELRDQISSDPLLFPYVDSQVVAQVISDWTGVPLSKIQHSQSESILNLRQALRSRIIGQSHALEKISEQMHIANAGLNDPRKPLGIFMLLGPSGVGKTETALALADAMFGGEQNLTVINLSEFKEEHKVSMLLGAPPGYVGFGEGGVLTEAARRKPYSVILLDEIEKAHPGVQDIFYNIFDKGTIKDGQGRDIDFRNTVIFITSNTAEQDIHALCAQHGTDLETDSVLDSIRPALLRYFKPAFLGRISVIPYFPLQDEQLAGIAELALKKLQKRTMQIYGAALNWSEDVILQLVARCQEVASGARNIEAIIQQKILPELAFQCLNLATHGDKIESIQLVVDEAEEIRSVFSFSFI